MSAAYTDTSLSPKPRREVWAVVLLSVPEDMPTEDVAANLAASVEFGRPYISVVEPVSAGMKTPVCQFCWTWPHRSWCPVYRPSRPARTARLACKAPGPPDPSPV